jgi:hypothetical protein
MTHSYPPPPTSSEVPDQEGVQTTLTGVIRFLKNDNDYARKVVENELEAKKQAEATFNALIIVVCIELHAFRFTLCSRADKLS